MASGRLGVIADEAIEEHGHWHRMVEGRTVFYDVPAKQLETEAELNQKLVRLSLVLGGECEAIAI